MTDTALVEFTGDERCDRCGMRAYHEARKDGRSSLMFCEHHQRQHFIALRDSGWEIVSDTGSMERDLGVASVKRLTESRL